MRKYVLVGMLLVGLSLCGGCSTEQLSDQFHQQLLAQESIIKIERIQNDPALSKEEKTKAAAMEVVAYTKAAGLLQPEDESAFLGYIEWAWMSYLMWNPEKSTVALWSVILALGVSWLKDRKKE